MEIWYIHIKGHGDILVCGIYYYNVSHQELCFCCISCIFRKIWVLWYGIRVIL